MVDHLEQVYWDDTDCMRDEGYDRRVDVDVAALDEDDLGNDGLVVVAANGTANPRYVDHFDTVSPVLLKVGNFLRDVDVDRRTERL